MTNKSVDFNKLFKMLKRIKRICEELDIIWCLTWGSLLGAIREQDFISGSNDDIVIFLINISNNNFEKFVKQFQNENYYVSCGNSNPSYIYAKNNYDKRIMAATEIDRIGFGEGDKNYYFFKNIPVHRNFLDNLKTAKIRDLECPIPNRAETLLEIMYEDWKVKNLSVHLSYDDFGNLSIVFNGGKKYVYEHINPDNYNYLDTLLKNKN